MRKIGKVVTLGDSSKIPQGCGGGGLFCGFC